MAPLTPSSRRVLHVSAGALVTGFLLPTLHPSLFRNRHYLLDRFYIYRKRCSYPQNDSYKSILKETNPEYSLEGLMLKLKLQYFGHLM